VTARSQPRRALVTGVNGQDGSFLAELLLERGYVVTGMVRDSVAAPLGPSAHLRGKIELVAGDLLDPPSLRRAVLGTRPHELYHLAAPSFVPDSWERPAETFAAIAGATATLLETVREHGDGTRVFLAASSAMFGAAHESPQREDTAFRPENPYASAKLAAHQLTGELRGHDGIFACSGILYNHESERRPESFVTRKITRAAAAIKLGLAERVELGDLGAVRDWSFAGDVMDGAWRMLQHDEPDDYILASGAEFADAAFACVGLRAEDHMRVDLNLLRPPEPTPSVGDPSRARQRLGWHPTVSFEQLVERMVGADMRDLAADR
jgi:GDPmannose 4,6-dehydratase